MSAVSTQAESEAPIHFPDHMILDLYRVQMQIIPGTTPIQCIDRASKESFLVSLYSWISSDVKTA